MLGRESTLITKQKSRLKEKKILFLSEKIFILIQKKKLLEWKNLLHSSRRKKADLF